MRSPSLPVRLGISWLTNALVLLVLAAVLDGVYVANAGDLLLAAAVFGVLNTLLKPLLRLITLPLAILTLGIAWFFVAMFILWLTDLIVSGMHIDGFWDLVGGTVVVWAVGVVADFWLFPKRRVGRS
jgi:putative membrane protein